MEEGASFDNGDSTLLFSQIRTFLFEMTIQLLEKGISINEIMISDVKFYLDVLDYRKQKEDLETEKEFDNMGL